MMVFSLKWKSGMDYGSKQCRRFQCLSEGLHTSPSLDLKLINTHEGLTMIRGLLGMSPDSTEIASLDVPACALIPIQCITKYYNVYLNKSSVWFLV